MISRSHRLPRLWILLPVFLHPVTQRARLEPKLAGLPGDRALEPLDDGGGGQPPAGLGELAGRERTVELVGHLHDPVGDGDLDVADPVLGSVT